jgi:hypothetical protein
MHPLSAMLSTVFGGRKPSKPRPKGWRVSFISPGNGRGYCDGLYPTKREATEAARNGIRPDCAPSTPKPYWHI